MPFRRLRKPLIALVATAALASPGAVAAQAQTGSGAVKVVGDTPADHPGVSSPAAPTTVVVRPTRTVVQTENQVLPIALAGLALVIALGGIVVLRARPAMPAGVSH
jgi:hypothetical protein